MSYENKTTEGMKSIETVVKSQRNESVQIEMALKEEIEEIAEQSKKVHSDHLFILKGITESMKSLKDKQTYLNDTDKNRQ